MVGGTVNTIRIDQGVYPDRIPLFIRQFSKREPANGRSARRVGNEQEKWIHLVALASAHGWRLRTLIVDIGPKIFGSRLW